MRAVSLHRSVTERQAGRPRPRSTGKLSPHCFQNLPAQTTDALHYSPATGVHCGGCGRPCPPFPQRPHALDAMGGRCVGLGGQVQPGAQGSLQGWSSEPHARSRHIRHAAPAGATQFCSRESGRELPNVPITVLQLSGPHGLAPSTRPCGASDSREPGPPAGSYTPRPCPCTPTAPASPFPSA